MAEVGDLKWHAPVNAWPQAIKVHNQYINHWRLYSPPHGDGQDSYEIPSAWLGTNPQKLPPPIPNIGHFIHSGCNHTQWGSNPMGFAALSPTSSWGTGTLTFRTYGRQTPANSECVLENATLSHLTYSTWKTQETDETYYDDWTFPSPVWSSIAKYSLGASWDGWQGMCEGQSPGFGSWCGQGIGEFSMDFGTGSSKKEVHWYFPLLSDRITNIAGQTKPLWIEASPFKYYESWRGNRGMDKDTTVIGDGNVEGFFGSADWCYKNPTDETTTNMLSFKIRGTPYEAGYEFGSVDVRLLKNGSQHAILAQNVSLSPPNQYKIINYSIPEAWFALGDASWQIELRWRNTEWDDATFTTMMFGMSRPVVEELLPVYRDYLVGETLEISGNVGSMNKCDLQVIDTTEAFNDTRVALDTSSGQYSFDTQFLNAGEYHQHIWRHSLGEWGNYNENMDASSGWNDGWQDFNRIISLQPWERGFREGETWGIIVPTYGLKILNHAGEVRFQMTDYITRYLGTYTLDKDTSYSLDPSDDATTGLNLTDWDEDGGGIIVTHRAPDAPSSGVIHALSVQTYAPTGKKQKLVFTKQTSQGFDEEWRCDTIVDLFTGAPVVSSGGFGGGGGGID